MKAQFAARTKILGQSAMWWRARSTAINHMQQCRALPPISEAELARMIAEFASRGSTVTQVATAYVLPTSTGMHSAQVG